MSEEQKHRFGGVKVTYGNLAAFTDRQKLSDELTQADLLHRLPRECKLKECVRYALTNVTARKMGLLLKDEEEEGQVKRLIRPIREAGVAGYTVQLETARGMKNEYRQNLAVSTVMDNGRETLVFSPNTHPLVTEIVMEIFEVQKSVPRSKLQYMLKKICLEDLCGVPEFDGGKPYFVPRSREYEAREVKRALKAASPENRMYVTTPLIDEDLLEQVLDGLQKKTEDLLKKIDSDIDGSTGERGLRNREGDAAAALSEIESYEKLLNINASALKTRVISAEKRVALAAMQAAVGSDSATIDPTTQDDSMFDDNPFA